MAVPIIVAAAAISAYGAIKSNSDRADAERQNADYFAEQAQYAQASGDRELFVFNNRADQVRARAIGSYAKSGVDLSGSPLAFLENQSIQRTQETNAMRAETARRVRLAELKGLQSEGMADNYSSTGNQFLSAAPSILNGAGGVIKNSGSSGSSSGTDLSKLYLDHTDNRYKFRD